MSLRDVIGNHISEWMKGTGPDSDIVIGSRIRLARNFEQIPFPAVAGPDQLKKVLDEVKGAVARDDGLDSLNFSPMTELEPLDRVLLVERHLISPQHTQNVERKAIALRDDESISVMINEEDHVRIQALVPGFQLEKCWELADRVDDQLESDLGFAFSEQWGFLTACPTNLGTAMRSSLMVHLPGLSITEQIPKVARTLSQFGLVIRGLYGEGTEMVGNIYQFSNQVTLGRSEREIRDHLKQVAQQVMGWERSARNYLLEHRHWQTEDRVWRAYGVLANARSINSHEAMRLLSDVRFGIDLGLITGLESRILQELLVMIRPAHLQKIMGREFDPPERDVYRASLIRERIQAG